MDDPFVIIRAAWGRRHDILEVACEQMLTDPRGWGVLVVDEEMINLEDLNGEFSYTARLDPDVPYGHVFQFPSGAAVVAWRDRGCPR